jgi:hypothetical protein
MLSLVGFRTAVFSQKAFAMTADQKIVAVGSVSGIISMILLMAIIYRFWPVSPELTDVAARLGYTVRALTFAALPLLIGIVTIANARISTDAIDSTRHAENRVMEINGRFVDNTVQQLLLFSIATLALSPALTPSGLRVIPIAVTVFVIARVVFWVGYRVRPIYRAPGMSATGYLNAGLLGYGIWRIIAG